MGDSPRDAFERAYKKFCGSKHSLKQIEGRTKPLDVPRGNLAEYYRQSISVSKKRIRAIEDAQNEFAKLKELAGKVPDGQDALTRVRERGDEYEGALTEARRFLKHYEAELKQC